MAQRDKDETKGETMNPKTASLGFRFFFFFFLKANFSTCRNPHLRQNWPELAEMTQNRLKSDPRWNMRYSRSYWFAYWYGIFQPFWPKRHKINKIEKYYKFLCS